MFNLRQFICNINRVKGYLIVLIVTFIVAFIIGLLFNKIWRDFPYLKNFYCSNFLCNESAHKQFMLKFFSNFGLLVIISVLSLTIYTVPLHFLIVLYNGTLLGCFFALCWVEYSFIGIITFLLAIFPFSILRAAAIILGCALGAGTAARGVKCKNVNIKELILNFVVALIIIILAFLLEYILVGLILKPLSMM